jgi:AraC-like DNA-binding protein
MSLWDHFQSLLVSFCAAKSGVTGSNEVNFSVARGQKSTVHTRSDSSRTLWSRRFWERLAADAHYDFEVFMARSPISARQMQRIFPQLFHCGPEEWFRRHKLHKASSLLQRGYRTKAVVEDLNFSSATYFCREFKKEYGASPKNFHSGALKIRHGETT